ncbi:S1C family serine protease [Candidatus Poriferisodalis sp.]|uniref:S1C family serine protease n=1 Tax=Candidatus Poriferisodalis sp. TaxID=3101277 RepID=UPI003B01D371
MAEPDLPVEPADEATSGRPGCLLVGIAGAVGALIGALTAGLLLVIVLAGDDSAPPVAAGGGVGSQAPATSAGSGEAEEATAGAVATTAAAVGNVTAPVASLDEALQNSPDVEGDSYLAQLLAGGVTGAGAPLGDRLAHINVKAVLEAVQEAVVIVDVTTLDGGEGGGSGFIVDADGLIVTNAHVVEDAGDIEVRFFGGERTRAEAIGVDTTRDLAVLQVEVGNLPTVPLGSSAGVEVGDEVIAIGNAIGIIGEPTVTAGIVSGLNRSIPLEDNKRLVRLIQTDAAINPGNSGGPLVNAAGEVIGINTAIAGGFVEGIGYAVSIDHARPVIDQLLEGIVQARAFFGVSLVSVDTLVEWQESQGYPDLEDLGDAGPETVEPGQDTDDAPPDVQLPPGVTSGAVVVIVVEGEAADAAGIVVGDVIVAFNGVRIESSLDLVTEILALVPGDSAEVTLIGSDGSQRVIEVTLGSFPTDDE